MLSQKSAEEGQSWLKSGKNFGNLYENQSIRHGCRRHSTTIKALFTTEIVLGSYDNGSGTKITRTATLLQYMCTA